jgi:hypothetical protein
MQFTQVLSNANVKTRKTRKLNIIEPTTDQSIRDVCKSICIKEVTIKLNTSEKPNDDVSISDWC